MTAGQTDSGVYLLILDIPQGVSLVVGSLGRVSVDPGRYGYVGSARRGLYSRLARHGRRRKPMRWHVDRLTRLAPPVGAVVWRWEPGRECALAGAIQKTGLGQIALDHFGASDCRCPGHLLKLRELRLRRIADRLSRSLGAGAGRLCSFPLTRHQGRRDAAAV